MYYALNTGDGRFQTSPFNTTVFVYPAEFSTRNHIYCRGENADPEEGFYVFGRQDLVDAFNKSGLYPAVYMPYVTDTDEAAYQHWVQSEHPSNQEKYNSITDDEVEEFLRQLDQDGVIGHMDELEDEQ